jgi:hypothetical protein
MDKQTKNSKLKRTADIGSGDWLGHVWILEEGEYYSDRGIVVCAAKTKAAMLRWIKSEYPNHRRNTAAKTNGEIYFENDYNQTWLRCERNDKCPLVA